MKTVNFHVNAVNLNAESLKVNLWFDITFGEYAILLATQSFQKKKKLWLCGPFS